MRSGHETGGYSPHFGDQNDGAAPEFVPLPGRLDPAGWFLIVFGVGVLLLACPLSGDSADVFVTFAIATTVSAVMNVVPMWDGIRKIAPTPPGAVVGAERSRPLRLVPVALVIVVFAGWIALVAADVLPAGTLGLAGGIFLGDGFADAWERRQVRRVQRERGRRLLRATKSDAVFKREYFTAP